MISLSFPVEDFILISYIEQCHTDVIHGQSVANDLVTAEM